MVKSIGKRSVVYGIIGSGSLIALYITIVSLFQGIDYTVSRFLGLWYLMVPLIVGFGFQIGLFTYIRDFMKMSPGTAGMSGGVSAVSMVACCAHHITDVIPVLGISVLGIFLLEYQPVFLIFGIVSNVIGILVMLNVAKKSRVRFKNKILRNLMNYDFKQLIVITIIAGFVAVAVFLVYQKFYGSNYSNAVSSELANKCATPSGYTDATWREHMSHHPDTYVECLK
ncbi:MAG: hypothetical protein HYW22_02995 [Candidatus Aenigmarchaeota archaeon]|nr:hypothetical protein [Candidatus Aenigmarchaeota archaeon]